MLKILSLLVTGNCGPCNLQSYNIVAACVLCSEIPMEQPPTEEQVETARLIVTYGVFSTFGA